MLWYSSQPHHAAHPFVIQRWAWGQRCVMRQLVGDVSAWAGNVATSVAIVFVNKILMNATGYGFKYGEQARSW